jgi:protein phosphatase
MGGHAAGDVASKMVVDMLPALLQQMETIRDISDAKVSRLILGALNELNDRVKEEGARVMTRSGMGATVVLTIVRGSQCLIAHLGDSRAYRLREKSLTQLTKDHSTVQNLLDQGKITEEEMNTHPARGQITRCIGMPNYVKPDMSLLELLQDDRLLLCSDGLTSMLTDDEIADLLKAHPDNVQDAAESLVNAANAAGGIDNIAVVLIDWREETLKHNT